MSYDVTITRLPLDALFDLKGPAEALAKWCPTLPAFPATPNTWTGDDNLRLCHTGPNRWLLRAPIAEEPALDTALRPTEAPPEVSIVRVSDTLTFFRLTGAEAAEVLAIGCPLDTHESAFPEIAATYTELFTLKAFLMRAPQGFDIAVEQSFADMVEDYFARATA